MICLQVVTTMEHHQIAMQEAELRKGPWLEEEDERLMAVVSILGERRWDALAKASGLRRNGKGCRLRWMNYLRPNLKHGHITEEEEHLIIQLHKQWGNRWSRIARSLPGRTDNEIKNYWRSYLRKKELILEQEQSNNIQRVPSTTTTYDSEQKSMIQPCEAFSSSCSNNGDCMSQKDDNLSTRAEFSGAIEELSCFGLAYSPYETKLPEWTSNFSKLENYGDDYYCRPEWVSGGYNDTCLWNDSLSIWDMD